LTISASALHLALAHLLEHVLQLGRLLLGQLDVAELALAEQRDLARLALVGSTMASSPAIGTSDRPWISTGIDGPAASIGLPFSSSMARTRPTRRPASTMSPRFSVPDCTRIVATGPLPLSRRASMTRPLAGVSLRRLQFQHFGLQQHLFEQIVDALAGLGRHRHEGRIAAVLFRHHALGHQFLLDAFRIGFRLVDLVHRHHQRHVGGLGVVDGFLGLRHDAVVGRHHQDDDVGGLGAAGTHGGKRLVARRVEEGDHAARRLDVVGTDVLGDAARLAVGDARSCGCSRAAKSCRGRRGPSR
jgi:hypothetical protein